MLIYPNMYIKSVLDVSYDIIKKNNIQGILVDLDNTLMLMDRTIKEDIRSWCKGLISKGIKICILTNTNKLDKINKASETLGLDYVMFSKKPFKSGFKKGQQKLGFEAKNIAVIGDQIFTDVVGGNRMKMFTILVEPLEKRDIFLTKIKRPLEQLVINRYVRKVGK